MKTLTDPKSSFEAMREAARNLGNLTEGRMLGTTIAGGGWVLEPAVPVKRTNPAVAKFSNPTVAEAIVAAMDRDLDYYDAHPRDLYDYYRREIEDKYFKSLVALGDQRIAPELARRYQAATGRYKVATEVRVRRKYASACYDLGDAEPMKDFAREVEKGSLKLPENRQGSSEQTGTLELTGVVASLVQVRIPECDRALYAMASPEHPYYAQTAAQVLDAVRIHGGRDAWLAHPFCLTILRKALDDTTPTQRTWTIAKDVQQIRGPGMSGGRSIPDALADPATRRDQAEERKCDQVAVVLGDLLLGLPGYSPLAKDFDARLAAMKRFLDRYQGRFRLLTRAESVCSDTLVLTPCLPPTSLR